MPVRINEDCTKCRELVQSRKRITWGYGNPLSPIMFVGEAPGRFGCDVTGIPFTKDESGEYFQTMINNVGWKKEDIYVTNMVKCCPPDNRTPKDYEINNCSMYLDYEIKSIKPRILVLMGKVPATHFHPNVGGIVSAWDRSYKVNDRVDIILPHPAYIMRNRKQFEIYYHRSFLTLKTMVDNINANKI